jgi:hypothetical protein
LWADFELIDLFSVVAVEVPEPASYCFKKLAVALILAWLALDATNDFCPVALESDLAI